MPTPNIIQFSLKDGDRQLLASLALPGESLGLTAKRIVTAVLSQQLEIPPAPPEPIPVSPDILLKMQDQITALETRMAALELDRQPIAILTPKKRA